MHTPCSREPASLDDLSEDGEELGGRINRLRLVVLSLEVVKVPNDLDIGFRQANVFENDQDKSSALVYQIHGGDGFLLLLLIILSNAELINPYALFIGLTKP